MKEGKLVHPVRNKG